MTPQFSVFGAIRDSLVVLSRGFVFFILLAAAIRVAWLLTITPAGFAEPATLEGWLTYATSLAVAATWSGLSQLGFVAAALPAIRGGRPSASDLLRALRFLPSVLGVSLLSFLPQLGTAAVDAHWPEESLAAVTTGLVLAAVSMVLLFLWWIAVPAIAVERRGVVGSLVRAAELTRGRRWRLIGLLLLVFVLVFAGMYLATEIGGMAIADLSAVVPLTFGGALWFAGTTLLTAFLGVLTLVVYCGLRNTREGTAAYMLAG